MMFLIVKILYIFLFIYGTAVVTFIDQIYTNTIYNINTYTYILVSIKYMLQIYRKEIKTKLFLIFMNR